MGRPPPARNDFKLAGLRPPRPSRHHEADLADNSTVAIGAGRSGHVCSVRPHGKSARRGSDRVRHPDPPSICAARSRVVPPTQPCGDPVSLRRGASPRSGRRLASAGHAAHAPRAREITSPTASAAPPRSVVDGRGGRVSRGGATDAPAATCVRSYVFAAVRAPRGPRPAATRGLLPQSLAPPWPATEHPGARLTDRPHDAAPELQRSRPRTPAPCQKQLAAGRSSLEPGCTESRPSSGSIGPRYQRGEG
jgi:hypothetical protein